MLTRDGCFEEYLQNREASKQRVSSLRKRFRQRVHAVRVPGVEGEEMTEEEENCTAVVQFTAVVKTKEHSEREREEEEMAP